MKYLSIFVLLLFLGVGCVDTQQLSQQSFVTQTTMKLTSPDFEQGGSIPSQFTCDGGDVNPQFVVSQVPEGATSLALIVDDPDAVKPTGKVWTHWTIWNMDPATDVISEKSVPEGAVEGMTDFGKNGWGGPCPPDGEHTYHFTLYALDTVLDLDSKATKADVKAAMEGHILAQTELLGRYKRVES